MNDDRGASEVLGYVLVISLVTMTISVVLVLGLGGLESSQEAERVNNMERAFDVLAHNVEEATQRGAPSRATEIRLADGSIEYDEPVIMNVTQDGDLIANISIATEPLVYESGTDTQIIYEAGAVIRAENNHSVMIRGPPFIIESDHVLINGIRTRPLSGSPTAIDRSGTALIRKDYLGSSVGTAEGGVINVSVTTPRPDAWERYFEDQELGEVVLVEDDEVVYQLDDTDLEEATITVVRSRVRVTLAD